MLYLPECRMGKMKDLDFVPTPREAGEIIADFADIPTGEEVLEPSAGAGDLADVLQKRRLQVVCIEIDPDLCDVLRDKGHFAIQGDFLNIGKAWAGARHFNYIVMTPPFGSGIYIDHIKAAHDLLRGPGHLTALLPQSLREKEGPLFREFRRWLDERCIDKRDMPSGSFPDSKTNVETFLVKLTKLDSGE